jgi:uncharacterized protein (DUF885 family)
MIKHRKPMPRIHRTSPAAAVAFFIMLPLVMAGLPAQPAHADEPSLARPHSQAAPAGAAFDAWAEQFAADLVRLDPQLASQKQYFGGAEQQALDYQLTPLTPAHLDRQAALRAAGMARLQQWLDGPLDPAQRVTAAVMLSELRFQTGFASLDGYFFEFNQFFGVHIDLVEFMTQVHPLRRASDVPAYLSRLEQMSGKIDDAIGRSRAASARSLLPPRVIVERARAQVEAFLAPDPARNPLVTRLAEDTATLGDLSPAARSEALAAATRIVDSQVRPAYGRLQVHLNELMPRTGEGAGIGRLPGGAAAYARALAIFTGSTMSADDIHAMGLREVARIEAEMDRHLRTLGFAEGSIAARMARLDASLQPRAGADPRPALLARYQTIVGDAERRSAALFNIRPRAPLEVRREPMLTEATASAHYAWPALDGSRPGIMWVPLPGPAFEMASMRSLTYHEGIPGHHFQLATQQELTTLPKFRRSRVFGGGTSHSEGWALYAEKLAIEQGWYGDDLPGLLGALGLQLFRARRLVVDTGLHAKGWTRQQAIDYGIGAQEVERYMAAPGQACAYMTGMLRIVAMREHARAELGPKFSLAAFHDVVLRTGSVPLDVLAQVVDAWIGDVKRS